MFQAILLSKLDMEEKKDVYKQSKKDADAEKKVQEQSARAAKNEKKQKKKNVMSLDQFNDMVNYGEDYKCEYYENSRKSMTFLIRSAKLLHQYCVDVVFSLYGFVSTVTN